MASTTIVARPCRAFGARFGLDRAHELGGFAAGADLDGGQHLGPGLVGGQPGDPLQLGTVPMALVRDLGEAIVQQLRSGCEFGGAAVEGCEIAGQLLAASAPIRRAIRPGRPADCSEDGSPACPSARRRVSSTALPRPALQLGRAARRLFGVLDRSGIRDRPGRSDEDPDSTRHRHATIRVAPRALHAAVPVDRRDAGQRGRAALHVRRRREKARVPFTLAPPTVSNCAPVNVAQPAAPVRGERGRYGPLAHRPRVRPSTEFADHDAWPAPGRSRARPSRATSRRIATCGGCPATVRIRRRASSRAAASSLSASMSATAAATSSSSMPRRRRASVTARRDKPRSP